jgi:hypothetical protein
MKAVASLAIICAVVVAGCGGFDESAHEQKVHQVAKEIRSIDRRQRTLSELQLLESEDVQRGSESPHPGLMKVMEEPVEHQLHTLIRSSTQTQIAEACEEVSESVFCKERKLAGQR